ncbi:hypothetical protein GCM10009093_16320 [Brevundimonas terrae]|uniref:Lipoprotein n=1 Tax=Brevundimonas terrae TaxID=363631 RepID=A0ABP3I4W9_9CAUL|nr:hypothetical protein [Brevundimonas terrae]NIJ26364.1 hypothetical protein [Brevundimonas terrae]
MKRLLIAAACLMMAACTTTAVRKAETVRTPEAGATILIVEPRIQLGMLTAGGVTEPREEWSQQARQYVLRHVQNSMVQDSHKFVVGNVDDLMEGRLGQVVRVNEAVIEAIIAHEYNGYAGAKLATKKDDFEWTIGDGSELVGQHFGADYALFISGNGTYASGGRVAAFVVASAFGVGIPLGQQQVMASLVDLKTGQVMWVNYAVAGPGADMREDAGAQSLVESLLKDAPLSVNPNVAP